MNGSPGSSPSSSANMAKTQRIRKRATCSRSCPRRLERRGETGELLGDLAGDPGGAGVAGTRGGVEPDVAEERDVVRAVGQVRERDAVRGVEAAVGPGAALPDEERRRHVHDHEEGRRPLGEVDRVVAGLDEGLAEEELGREAGFDVLGLHDEVAALVEVDAVRGLVAGGVTTRTGYSSWYPLPAGPGVDAEGGGELGDVDGKLALEAGRRAASASAARAAATCFGQGRIGQRHRVRRRVVAGGVRTAAGSGRVPGSALYTNARRLARGVHGLPDDDARRGWRGVAAKTGRRGSTALELAEVSYDPSWSRRGDRELDWGRGTMLGSPDRRKGTRDP